MKTLGEQLIEAGKKNHKALRGLKSAAVAAQVYDVAAKLREIEKELFPESEEQKTAKHEAKLLNAALRMVDLNIKEDLCWLIRETLIAHNEKKGAFSIEDAANIQSRHKEIFQID